MSTTSSSSGSTSSSISRSTSTPTLPVSFSRTVPSQSIRSQTASFPPTGKPPGTTISSSAELSPTQGATSTSSSTTTPIDNSKKDGPPIAAIVGPVLGVIILTVAIFVFICRRRKRGSKKIKTTKIHISSPLPTSEMQYSGGSGYHPSQKYTNLPSPPRPPIQAAPYPQTCTPFELPKKPPQRPAIRPDEIPKDLLDDMGNDAMEFIRRSPASMLPRSHLRESIDSNMTGFRDRRRDTGASFGFPQYRRQSFNLTLADEHPELYPSTLAGYDRDRRMSPAPLNINKNGISPLYHQNDDLKHGLPRISKKHY